jgi:uncharacterized membrane protein YcaP (DUF421 family)
MSNPTQGIITLDPLGLLVIFLRTLIVYLVLVLAIRAFGKREIGQMTAFDLVVILMISNAVQNAMTGPDTSVTGGVVAAFTLLLANWGLARIAERSTMFHRLFLGEPTLLIYNGKMLTDRMRREGVDQEELLMAAREHGMDDLSQVQTAVLEIDGTISVVPKEGEPFKARRRKRYQRHR